MFSFPLTGKREAYDQSYLFVLEIVWKQHEVAMLGRGVYLLAKMVVGDSGFKVLSIRGVK